MTQVSSRKYDLEERTAKFAERIIELYLINLFAPEPV